MLYSTVGRQFNAGKVAHIVCVKNNILPSAAMQGQRFLLVVLTVGRLTFLRDGQEIIAHAPAFVCFDECENVTLKSRAKAAYWAVYFHPDFLNVNMTFDFIRAARYADIASTHDMFLLKPFLQGVAIVPLGDAQVMRVEDMCEHLQEELTVQRDWYWSCRGRSYFIELMIALERMYGLCDLDSQSKTVIVKNPKLRAALLYIEGHFMENVSLADICRASGFNRTSLTAAFHAEMGMTATQYLYLYRIQVAKKQLEFTDVPIKDIAARVGFKTVPHFNRVFTQRVGETPAQFRKTAVQKRKDEMRGY